MNHLTESFTAGPITRELAALRQEYLAHLPGRLREIGAAWNGLHVVWTTEGVRTIYRLAHALAGSGASYGFAELSVAAQALTSNLRPLLNQTSPPAPALIKQLAVGLAELQLVARAQQDHDPAPPPLAPVEERRSIYLFDADGDTLGDLSGQFGFFGYDVSAFTRLESLLKALRRRPPSAMIVDVDFPGGRLSTTPALSAISHARHIDTPLIYLGQRDDIAHRLWAVRHGGSAYFPRPIPIGPLLDTIDRLTTQVLADPYRVLFATDDPHSALACRATLEAAGMVVNIVDNPLGIYGPLAEFQPDVLLLDLQAPGCDGLELAAVLRQQEDFLGLTIVFMATEGHRLQESLRLGTDDALAKPVAPERLIASVTSRARRARLVRASMTRDSMTGLINHTAIKEQLSREVARANRHGSQVSFGLMDVDHFKRVNDTYGHPAGDRVLKSLARLLQQRLRRSDLIGRYGGEEFAVVLPDTSGEAATHVMDELRVAFGQIQQSADNVVFTCTLSCGIATFPMIADPAELIHAADTSLYSAKKRGRNRVVLASALAEERLTALPTAEPSVKLVNESSAVPLTERVRVMVVDDDQDMRALIQTWLGERSYSVAVLESGEEAVVELERNPPDLLFLDILMPGINGLQVLELIRDSALETSVVLTTAFGSEAVAIDALRRGADDYLRKPFTQREFQTTLERNVARFMLRRQNILLQQQLDEKRKQLETELTRAARVRADMLPRTVPLLQGYELVARCVPAREIGGDFYDWFEPDNGRLNLTLGDVRGHGMPAALLMTTVRSTLRAVARQTPALTNMRYAVHALEPDLVRAGSVVELFHAQLNLTDQTLSYVDAGHGGGLVLAAEGTVTPLGPRGVPVGVPCDEVYEAGVVRLAPGDTVLLYSAGVRAASADLTGADYRQCFALLEHPDGATRLVEYLLGPAAEQRDADLTVLVLRRHA